MSPAGPRLHDIHLPQVSWWPPAPGWWFLAASILVVVLALSFVWLRGRNARALRHAACRELDALAAGHARDRNDVVLAAGLSRLLRRIALVLQPEVVADNDLAWHRFLSDRAQAAFTGEQLDALIEGPYRTGLAVDAAALLSAARRWCECALRPRMLAARDRP